AVDRGHPAGEGEAVLRVLERREVLLERPARRVVRAGVAEALVDAGLLLAEGRGLVDREGDRARDGVVGLAGMDGARVEAIRHGCSEKRRVGDRNRGSPVCPGSRASYAPVPG